MAMNHPESGRFAKLVLSALVVVVGLQSMRFLFASLTWYLRDTRGIGVLDLVPIAFAPFLLAGLIPVLSRWVGRRAMLWVGLIVLAVARTILQISLEPSVDFLVSAIGTMAFVGLLPLLLGLGRIALVGGVLLGLTIDTAIKGLGLSLDLAFQPGWRPVFAVVALGLGMVWGLLNSPDDAPTGVNWGDGWTLLSIGPFLFVETLILQSQGWTSAVAGMSGPAAQLRISLLNIVALYLAYRWRVNRPALAVAAFIVFGAVLTAEGDGASFNMITLVAAPMAGVLWAGMVPSVESRGAGAQGLYLIGGMIIYLALGLAYYLPLDLSLGFSQGDVRHLASVLVLGFGLVALLKMPLGDGVGSVDWVFGAAAAVLSIAGFAYAIGTETVSKEDPDGPVRFMTYNVHSAFNTAGELNVEDIARVVEDSEADVVAFQEMPRGRLISATTDLMTLLRLRLGFEHVAFFGTTDPVWGNAVFSRYPIVDLRTDYLPRVGTPMQRGYLGATIRLGDQNILVISTHLQHINDPDVHDEDPEADLLPVHTKQIEKILDSWAGQMPAILMGDFNSRPDWAQIAQVEAAGWIDVWDEIGIGEGLTSGSADPRYRIDYIFHTSDLIAVDGGVIQSTASDHFPVVADIDFSK